VNVRRITRTITTTLAAVLMAAVFIATARAVPAQASTTTDMHACRAFATYELHHTRYRREVLARDGRRADTYLRVDIRGFLRHQDKTTAGYVRTDCTTTGDE
jgi:hypothetical protein